MVSGFGFVGPCLHKMVLVVVMVQTRVPSSRLLELSLHRLHPCHTKQLKPEIKHKASDPHMDFEPQKGASGNDGLPDLCTGRSLSFSAGFEADNRSHLCEVLSNGDLNRSNKNSVLQGPVMRT